MSQTTKYDKDSSDDESRVKVKVFNGKTDKFILWKDDMCYKLKGKGLWNVVENGIDSEATELKEQLQRKLRAKKNGDFPSPTTPGSIQRKRY